MTISEQTPTVAYTGDGVATVFSFAFQILDNADLIVTVNAVTQVENTDYTIENLTVNGGDVDFGISAAPADGDAISIARNTPRDQDVIYTPFDPFPAKTHEGALDKLTLIVQELVGGVQDVDLSDVLSLDDTKTFWEADTKRIKNLVQPQDPNDAATKQYADDITGSGFDPTVDRTITGAWEFTQVIVGVVDGNPAKALDEVISGAWEFQGKVTLTGGALLAFNLPLKGLDQAGTGEVFLAVVGMGDRAFYGDINHGTTIFSDLMTLVAGGFEVLNLDGFGNVVMRNDGRYQARNAGDTNSVDLLRLDNADLIWLGSQSENLRLQVLAEYDFRVAGIQAIRMTSSNIEFKKTVRSAQDIRLQFDPALGQGQTRVLQGIIDESPGTETRDFVHMNNAQQINFGDILSNGRMRYDEFFEMVSAGGSLALFTQTAAEGSLLINDPSGDPRKVGFRNPGARFVTGTPTLVQADEGQYVQCDSVTTDITVPPLDVDTQITVINRQNASVTLTADAGLTDGIEFFDGQGSFPTGNRTIPGGGVAHIRYRTALGISLWGNGIT